MFQKLEKMGKVSSPLLLIFARRTSRMASIFSQSTRSYDKYELLFSYLGNFQVSWEAEESFCSRDNGRCQNRKKLALVGTHTPVS